ncbi:hypothetical protein BESB_018540 [Besnoitia besnoiti]|uniref:Uncharacterized protein n=1 Tax=Besnoitia besnoiti TaxID=94643 RepID=A0A2A9M9F1_BESBE|nr:hypothetical protein BESB_018540 [Besnoitia besnoiti]PFH32536.1 hypothetical protein BESB_018540 [Besnoitia besnoiti]
MEELGAAESGQGACYDSKTSPKQTSSERHATSSSSESVFMEENEAREEGEACEMRRRSGPEDSAKGGLSVAELQAVRDGGQFLRTWAGGGNTEAQHSSPLPAHQADRNVAGSHAEPRA